MAFCIIALIHWISLNMPHWPLHLNFVVIVSCVPSAESSTQGVWGGEFLDNFTVIHALPFYFFYEVWDAMKFVLRPLLLY